MGLGDRLRSLSTNRRGMTMLDAEGIDTSEYRDRAASVLNVNGGMNTFGGEAKNYGTVQGASVPTGSRA